MAASPTETFPTPSDGTYGVGNMEVEEDIDIIEESLMAINNCSIKQEEIPEDISFPDIKSEADEVRYVCVCLLLDILKIVFVLFWWGGGRPVSASCVAVRVIVEGKKFCYSCREKSISTKCFPMVGPIKSVCTVEFFLMWNPQQWRGVRLLYAPFTNPTLYLPNFLQVIFCCVSLYHRLSTVQSCMLP
jgi:predicted small integral membrane protein